MIPSKHGRFGHGYSQCTISRISALKLAAAAKVLTRREVDLTGSLFRSGVARSGEDREIERLFSRIAALRIVVSRELAQTSQRRGIVRRMDDASTRSSRRRRTLPGKGALSDSARPSFSSSRETESHPTPRTIGEGAPSPPPRASRGGARTSFPDLSRIRRFGRMLMHRGEGATKDGNFTEAAIQFERAAWAFEHVTDPLAAAEATLELGRCLLYLRHGEMLPALAGRIEILAREQAKNLPAGGFLTLRVWAAILRRAEIEPSPFLQLIRLRRRDRRVEAPQPHASVLGGLPVIDGMPRLFLKPPPDLREPHEEDWTLSPDGNWFVFIINDPSAASRIEKGGRMIDLARLLDCPARWEIEKKRVIVKVAADRRGYDLIALLRGEALQDQEAVS